MEPFSKKPVSIISKEALDQLLKGTRPAQTYGIPYQCVGNTKGILQGIEIDYMVILQGSDSQIVEKPMIAITEQPFAGIFHYSILLHNDFC